MTIAAQSGDLPAATAARDQEAAGALYLDEVRTESQTIRTDRSACRRICATVIPGGKVAGEIALSKVTWKAIEEIYEECDGLLSPVTQARYASTLSKVLEHAKRSGWMTSSPVADARRPKVPTHRPDVPSSPRSEMRCEEPSRKTSRCTRT